MSGHEHFMRRCLQLARNGAGQVAPNPMVGALLVQGDRVLAEGWHRTFGGPHAEVECLRAFGDGPVPEATVMYVNLEPCAHHGKTPPCVDLLIARGLKHMVIGCTDPNPQVQGQGIARAREAGIEVIQDVLRDECRWLNRRFLHSFEQQRPYVILKWACSADGFMDKHPRTMREVQRISSPTTDVLVHRWRSEEQAILVGSRTVVNDDPSLTVRHVEGRNPLRVVIDRRHTIPLTSKLFDGTTPTLLITVGPRDGTDVEQYVIRWSDDALDDTLGHLHKQRIRSVLVEGGATLLGHFIQRGLWNEAREITGTVRFDNGTIAPVLPADPVRSFINGPDRIDLFVNGTTPNASWEW